MTLPSQVVLNYLLVLELLGERFPFRKGLRQMFEEEGVLVANVLDCHVRRLLDDRSLWERAFPPIQQGADNLANRAECPNP